MRVAAAMRRACWLAGLAVLAACGGPEAPQADGQVTAPTAAAPAPDSPPPAPVSGSDEAQLLRLEQDYARALIAKDRDFLMRFYAPDWRGGNWMGFWTKSTMLKAVLGEQYVVKSMTLRNVRVRVIGDVGIVQGLDEEVTRVRGRDTSGKWTFTDIFARRDGRWVAIASHTSEVRPEPR